MKKSKIVYSKYTSADFGSFETLVYNEEVMRYISGKALTTLQARDKFDSILAINDEEEYLGYFKVYNTDKEFLGDCKLERCKHDSTKLEIGYILKKKYWGQGYGTRICTAMLTLAKKISPEKDIIGIVDPDNIASKKLLEKFGFESYFIGIEDGLSTEKLILKSKRCDQ